MRKYLGVLGLVLVLCAAVPVLGFADIAEENLYTVDSNGSTDKKTVFGWSETPWLFMHLPDLGGTWAVEASWWHSPDTTFAFAATSPSTSETIWLSPDTWGSIKKVGTWVVNAGYYTSPGVFSNGQTTFTVTPEPLSVSLFLLGAGAIALRKRRNTSK